MSARRAAEVFKGAAVLLVGLVLMHWMSAGQDEIVSGPPPESHLAQGLDVLDGHAEDCWQGGEAPLASLPSAAIIRWPGGAVVHTDRPALVDAAFTEALGLADAPRLDVIALCR